MRSIRNGRIGDRRDVHFAGLKKPRGRCRPRGFGYNSSYEKRCGLFRVYQLDIRQFARAMANQALLGRDQRN